MKNVFYGQVFFAFFLASFFLYSPTADAQIPIETEVMKICGLDVGTGGAPGPCGFFSYPANLDESCQGEINTYIFMVNLEDYHSVKGYYTLPTELPEIWVRHESSPGNWILSGPYSTAQYVGPFTLANGESGDLYGIPLTLEIEAVENLCGGPEYPDFYKAIRRVEIVTPTEGEPIEYIPFPIHQFSDPTEVWSCNAFYDTWCDCHPDGQTPTHPPISCEGFSPDPSYELDVCFECNGCVALLGGGLREQKEELVQPNKMELQISPNPFDQEMNLSVWIPQDGEVTYALYDARGQMVWQQIAFQEKGLDSKPIATSNLTSGVYYLHYRQGDQQGVQKVLKIK